MDLNVTVGRLPEARRTPRTRSRATSEADARGAPSTRTLLGLSIAPLTDDLARALRHRPVDRGRGYHRGRSPNSPAAQKDVKPGDVIVEVTQEKVKQPQDVKASLLAVQEVRAALGAVCCSPTPKASSASSPCRPARAAGRVTKAILIAGPTASGKSAAALELA